MEQQNTYNRLRNHVLYPAELRTLKREPDEFYQTITVITICLQGGRSRSSGFYKASILEKIN